jgi:hypothetical protein
MLPGDGDTNVAKPPPAKTVAPIDDAWTGTPDLIAAPPVKPPPLDVPEFAITEATAAAASPLVARAANVDISRVSFEP